MTVEYIRGAVESLGLPTSEAFRQAFDLTPEEDKNPADEHPTIIEHLPDARRTVILSTTQILEKPVLSMTVLFPRNNSFSTVYFADSEIDREFQLNIEAAVRNAQQKARDTRHNP